MNENPPPVNNPNGLRETLTRIGKSTYAMVDVQTKDGDWIEAQKLREDGDRITVRWTDAKSERGHVVRTVFRKTFDRWQEEAPDK